MVTVAATLRDFIQWAEGVLRADLARSVIVSASTGLLLLFWRQIWRASLRAAGREKLAQPKPAETWPSDDLARVYTPEDVKSGLVVAPGTRMVIVDGGIKQCALGAGTYSGKDVERLLRKYAIRKSGVALQYSTTPLEVHARVDGVRADTSAEIVLDVRVEDDRAEKLLTWVPLRDGVAGAADVQHLMKDKVGAWLQPRLQTLLAPGSGTPPGPLDAELEPFLNRDVFAEHGMSARVRAVTIPAPNPARTAS